MGWHLGLSLVLNMMIKYKFKPVCLLKLAMDQFSFTNLIKNGINSIPVADRLILKA